MFEEIDYFQGPMRFPWDRIHALNLPLISMMQFLYIFCLLFRTRKPKVADCFNFSSTGQANRIHSSWKRQETDVGVGFSTSNSQNSRISYHIQDFRISSLPLVVPGKFYCILDQIVLKFIHINVKV